MAKMRRPVVIDFLLGLINFFLNISGMSIIVYALIHLMKLKLFGSQRSDDWSDRLSSTWFIYLLVTTGTILFVTSVSGCIATSTWSPTFLTLYCVLLFGLMVAELGVAACIFFDHKWEEDLIMNDKSGSVESIYHFFKTHWTFLRWVLVAALVLQAIGFIMSMYLRYLCDRGGEEDEERRLVQPLQQPPKTTASRVFGEAMARPGSKQHAPEGPALPRPAKTLPTAPQAMASKVTVTPRQQQQQTMAPLPARKLNPQTK